MALNWQAALTHGATGGLSGAASGSVIPGLGTAAGAGIGGLGGFLEGLFSGTDEDRQRQFQNFTPEQQAALTQLLQQGLQDTDFNNISQEANRNFQTNTIPSIAERFTAMGGGQRSSAFQGALGSAASQLNTGLGALRAQYGQQKLGLGLQPRFENAYFPRQPGSEKLLGPSINAALTNRYAQSLKPQGQQNRTTPGKPLIDQSLLQPLGPVPGLSKQLGGV